jgi:hypothetical protein
MSASPQPGHAERNRKVRVWRLKRGTAGSGAITPILCLHWPGVLYRANQNARKPSGAAADWRAGSLAVAVSGNFDAFCSFPFWDSTVSLISWHFLSSLFLSVLGYLPEIRSTYLESALPPRCQFTGSTTLVNAYPLVTSILFKVHLQTTFNTKSMLLHWF